MILSNKAFQFKYRVADLLDEVKVEGGHFTFSDKARAMVKELAEYARNTELYRQSEDMRAEFLNSFEVTPETVYIHMCQEIIEAISIPDATSAAILMLPILDDTLEAESAGRKERGMRENLFRGKHSETNEWWYGDLFHTGKRVFIRRPSKECLNNPPTFYEHYSVNPETVGQFTGWLDKNDVKIFDGDVVKTKTGRLCVVYWLSSPSFCGWDLKPVKTVENIRRTPAPPSYDLYLKENLEVIGNIHDNPELLKGAEPK